MATRSFTVSTRSKRAWPKISAFQKLVALEDRLAESGQVTMNGSGAGDGVCEIFGETDLSDEALAALVRSLKPPRASELTVMEARDGEYRVRRTMRL